MIMDATHVLLVMLWSVISQAADVTVDPNGYIMYCPCMGKYRISFSTVKPVLHGQTVESTSLDTCVR